MTKELDDIVKVVKAKPEVGIRYMRGWEHDQELLNRIEDAENTAEAERKKAEAERKKAEHYKALLIKNGIPVDETDPE